MIDCHRCTRHVYILNYSQKVFIKRNKWVADVLSHYSIQLTPMPYSYMPIVPTKQLVYEAIQYKLERNDNILLTSSLLPLYTTHIPRKCVSTVIYNDMRKDAWIKYVQLYRGKLGRLNFVAKLPVFGVLNFFRWHHVGWEWIDARYNGGKAWSLSISEKIN